MLRKSLVPLAFLAFLNGGSPAGEPALVSVSATEEVGMGLDARVERFLARGESVRDLLMGLCKEYNVGILISPRVPDTPVTARLFGLTVREVIDIVTVSAGLSWEEENGGRIARVDSGATDEQVQAMEGLDRVVEVFVLHKRPLRDALNMLAQYGNLSFSVGSIIQEVPITAHLNGMTVREILNRILPEAGLVWMEIPEQNLIRVMVQEEGSVPVVPTITRVFTIRHASMQNVSPVVQQLQTEQGKQYHIPAQRKIIVTDTPDAVARIEEAIQGLDRVPKSE